MLTLAVFVALNQRLASRKNVDKDSQMAFFSSYTDMSSYNNLNTNLSRMF